MATSNNLQFQILKPSFETLGVVVDYLSKSPGFAEYKFGEFCTVIKHQLATGCHFAAIRDRNLVGYTGWVYTTITNGKEWMSRDAELHPVDAKLADAAALTVVAIDERPILLPMIRCLRNHGAGKRIFFKREYAGAHRPARKNTVLNTTRPSQKPT